MLPVSFESIFEQGVAKIDDSVRQLQKSYDEVVWGVESPPDYVAANKSSSNGKSSGSSKPKRSHHHASTAPLLAPESTRSRSSSKTKSPRTPNTDAESSTYADDSTHFDDEESSYAETSGDDHHSRRMKRWRAWKHAAHPKQRKKKNKKKKRSFLGRKSSSHARNSSTSMASPSRTSSEPVRSVTPNSITEHDEPSPPRQLPPYPLESSSQQQFLHKPKEQRLRNKLEARTIDEIFGYNTKQTITKTKTHPDQDVGLQVCNLDAPSKSGFVRSLLLVESIDPNGLFANSGIGVGDAILAINGVCLKEAYGRNAQHDQANTFGNSNFRPSLYKARALLNGRGIRLTIEYQKFGETSGLATVSSSSTPESSPFRSTNTHRTSSSARLDFVGSVQTTGGGYDEYNETTTDVPSSPDKSSSSSTEVTEHLSGTEQRSQPGTPPKISRLTQLRARTHQLRASNQTNKQRYAEAAARSLMDSTLVSSSKSGDDEDDRDRSQSQQQQLPYSSLNYGPEDRIQLLKDRVQSSEPRSASPGGKRASSSTSSPAWTPSRSTRSAARVLDVSSKNEDFFYEDHVPVYEDHSPSRRSDSYLHDLRRELSPTANDILDDLSACGTAEQYDAIAGQQEGLLSEHSTAVLSDEHRRELLRINRKIFAKLQGRVDGLRRSNMQLSDELSALKKTRCDAKERLEQSLKKLEQAESQAQVYTSQLSLAQSRLDICTIQADKRQRELTEAREEAIAKHDRIVAKLGTRIEALETANQRLLEQLKKVEAKKQDKYNSLHNQFERLKMKFSAQSTLLDNVMTANEELTSQNEGLEAELSALAEQQQQQQQQEQLEQQQQQQHPPPLSSSPPGAAGIFSERSEYDSEHVRRDPILLAQARELSTAKERNAELEEEVERLSKLLLVNEAGNLPPNSLLDVTTTSSVDEGSLAQLPKQQQQQQQQQHAGSASELNVSTDTPTGEDATFPSGCLPTLPRSPKKPQQPGDSSCCGSSNPGDPAGARPDTTVKLHYQHDYDLRCPSSATSTTAVDESFESASSLVLMERILELENALQESDLDPEDTERFLGALHSRISRLNTTTNRGKARVGNTGVRFAEI